MNDNQEKNKGSTKTGLSQIQTKHVLSSSDSLSKHNHPARSKKFHEVMKKASRRRYNSPHIDDNSNDGNYQKKMKKKKKKSKKHRKY